MKPKQTASVRPFYADESMGTFIDTRGLPLTHLVRSNTAEPSFLDPKFAPLSDDRPGRLRNEIPRFITANSNDAEVRQVLREAGIDDEASASGTVYIRANGEEIEAEVENIDGVWSVVANGKSYTGGTRDAALMLAARELNERKRGLTDQERLEVSRIAQSNAAYPGNILVAIDKYVTAKAGVPMGIAYENARYLDVLNEAVLFCWTAANNGFRPSPEFDAFVAAYAAGRPLTLPMLDSARLEFERERRQDTLLPLPEAEEESAPSYDDLDSLGEKEFQQQFKDVVKERARLIRRGVL